MKRLSICILLALLIGCRSQSPTPPPPNTTDSSAASASATPTIMTVSTTPVVAKQISRTLEITGNLEGQEDITVSSEVEGTIAEMFIDLGTYVKAGDKLFSLDSRELQWKVQQAEANVQADELKVGIANGKQIPLDQHPEIVSARLNVDQAKIDLERADRLLKSGDIARQEYDRVKLTYDQAQVRLDTAYVEIGVFGANLSQARAALELTRKQLADAVVRSPVSGLIKERLVAKGEYLTKGRNVARIVQSDTLRLRTSVPEPYIGQLHTGQAISFHTDALADKQFQGIVTRFSPSLDKASRSLMIEATIHNDGQLKPGMFARATVTLGAQGNSLLVPQKAIVTTAGLSKVFVVVQGQARVREVKLGQNDGEMVEILEGLEPNLQVITDNLDRLADGSPIQPKA